jgi:hypothetical protein
MRSSRAARAIGSFILKVINCNPTEYLLYLQYNRVWWDASAVSQDMEKMMKKKKKQRVE